MGFGEARPRASAARSSARCMKRWSSVIAVAGSRRLCRRPPGGSSLRDERVDETGGIERLEVLDLFADSKRFDRHAELAHDAHDDPALRGAVELRETQTG